MRMGGGDDVIGDEGELEIHYQEPPKSYFGKFKRNWALHFGFFYLDLWVYGFFFYCYPLLLV